MSKKHDIITIEEVQAQEASLETSEEDEFLKSMNNVPKPVNTEDDDALKVFKDIYPSYQGKAVAINNYINGNEIFYVESCVYLMTLYDLVTSGHRVWQVYDCFYAAGEEDQELFDFMISSGVKRNFEDFLSVWWKE